MKFLTKVFKTTSKQEDVIIPAGLDNLTTPGITKGVITLFGEVARATQISAGANSTGWVQTIQTVNNLAFADRMRSIGLADTVTVKNSVDTIVSNGAGNVINQATVETFSGGIPSNFATSNSIIRNSYDVLIPEKIFYSNTQNFTANVDNFNLYVSNQLDNNSVYANANVTTSVQYAINNGYTEDWTTLNSASFDVSMNSLDVQDLAELEIARTKTAFLNNKYFG